jgi:hypothetical protein
MHCCKKYKKKEYNVEQSVLNANKSYILQKNMGGYGLHKTGRKTANVIKQFLRDKDMQDTVNFSEYLQSLFLKSFFSDNFIEPVDQTDTNLLQFYRNKVCLTAFQSLDLNFKTLNQRCNLIWQNERKIRITSSICRQLYTYSKNNNPNWTKKLSGIYQSKQGYIPSLAHGIKYEEEALKAFIESLSGEDENEKMGLLVHPLIPWLGYSPDGFLKKSRILLEIKCPSSVKRTDTTINNLLDRLPYFEKNGNAYHLKRAHQYFSQVQLGMFILNVQKCKFIIYHSSLKEIWSTEILMDRNYIYEIVRALRQVYFKYILPFVCN